MKVTVTDGYAKKTHAFREGTRASDIIAELGFDFPLPCGGLGRCGKCLCRIDGELKKACRTALFRDAVIELETPRTDVMTASEHVEGADGVVIDVGTTTVAAALFENGCPTRAVGRRNPQCAFGADVISRIGAKNTAPLTQAVRSLVNEIRAGFGPDLPTVIVGNTAMLALYAGLDVRDMGVWPFTPPSLFGSELDGAYLPRCASAFIGADALCSLLWSRAADLDEPSLVADLGTNGELMLVYGGKVYAASAAAGPALEGIGIEHGMAAASGAICRVSENGFEVIGGGEALGIAGSGLVDAVALMLKLGELDQTGRLKKDFEIPGSGIRLSQSDVRAYQLCKAAIYASAAFLLKSAGLRAEELSKVYLSGALGKSINTKNAALTGLLPDLKESAFIPIGNGALLGGAMLLSERGREKYDRLAGRCQVINTAADPDFARLYIDAMNFNVV